jgi:hypothetical protein
MSRTREEKKSNRATCARTTSGPSPSQMAVSRSHPPMADRAKAGDDRSGDPRGEPSGIRRKRAAGKVPRSWCLPACLRRAASKGDADVDTRTSQPIDSPVSSLVAGHLVVALVWLSSLASLSWLSPLLVALGSVLFPQLRCRSPPAPLDLASGGSTVQRTGSFLPCVLLAPSVGRS